MKLRLSKGGWGGIRTHERLSPLPVFKTGAFNRSATHPEVDPVGGDASPPSTNLHFAVSADRGLHELADFASTSIRPRPRPIRTDILAGYTAAPSAAGRLRSAMPLPHGTTSMHALGYILAVAASVLWGLTYCLDERVLEHLSVFKLYFLHCVCGAVVAAVILLARGTPPEALFSIGNSSVSLPLFGLTLATATAAALAILGSIQLLGANTSAVLEISYPLFVALFSVLFFKGQLQMPVVIGGAFIFIGSAIIVLAR